VDVDDNFRRQAGALGSRKCCFDKRVHMEESAWGATGKQRNPSLGSCGSRNTCSGHYHLQAIARFAQPRRGAMVWLRSRKVSVGIATRNEKVYRNGSFRCGNNSRTGKSRVVMEDAFS